MPTRVRVGMPPISLVDVVVAGRIGRDGTDERDSIFDRTRPGAGERTKARSPARFPIRNKQTGRKMVVKRSFKRRGR